MLKKIYQKLRSLAASSHSRLALGAISFCDAWLFPMPPEIMLIPASAMRPKEWWQNAIIATFCSIIGGMLGFAIGWFLMDTIGHSVLSFIGLDKKLPAIQEFYRKWGTLAIIIKGLTPFPYLVISIFSGSVKFPFGIFIGASLLTRAMRFLGVSWLSQKFGPSIEPFIEKQLYWVTGALAVVIIIGVWIVTKV